MQMPKVLSSSFLLVVLMLIGPRFAAAQAGASLGEPGAEAPLVIVTPAPAPVPNPPGAPSVVDPEIIALRNTGAAPTQALPPPEPSDSVAGDGPTFGASFGHAAGGYGLGVAVGAGLGTAVMAAATCPSNDSVGCVFNMSFGAIFGAAGLSPLGAALGAWGFGERRGGTGNFFAALGGAYLGAGVGVGVAALVFAFGDGLSAWGMVLGPAVGSLMAMVGAAAGYQLSSHGSREPTDPEALSLVPTLDINQHGATAGLTGTF